MRISTSMQFENQLYYMQLANSKVDEASKQYNTGLKFQQAGDDPSGMSQKIKYTADTRAYEQYQINAGMAADALSQSETALSSLWDVLGNVKTRLQQAVNGTMDQNSLDAIAEDLEQAQAQIFDLMNTKNAEGEYIFSGHVSSQPCMTITSDGHYVCQADGGSREVQVSPTVTVQTTDSGLNIFENVELAREFSVQAPGGGEVECQITNYDDYMKLYDEYFDPTLTYNPNTGDNTIAFNVQADGTFTAYAGGVEIGTGELTDKGKIEFKGMTVEVGNPPTPGNYNSELKRPEKGNILNVLNEAIAALRDDSLSNEELAEQMAAAQISVQNAMDNYDMYRGQIGARAANIDTIIASDESLGLIKQTAQANVTEIDAYEAVSNLMREQLALQVAQQTYSVVHQSNLFDYI